MSAAVCALLCLAGVPLAGAAGTVTVSPGSLAFGNQVQGIRSAIKKVTLTNGLSKALSITSLSMSLADYSQTNTCPISPATLAAGAKCTISVSFTPAAVGQRGGMLSVNDSATGSPQKVNLSGTGVLAAVATPSSLGFGNQVIGLKSASQIVTFQNNQSKGLKITSITTGLTDYSETTTCPLSPNTLGGGATCTITVFFTPSAAGSRSSTLTVANDSGTSPSVSLSGSGIVATTLSPASLSYSGQALGTSSGAQTVTLTNNQSTALTLTGVTSSASDFSSTTTCPLSPSTLAAGGSCTAWVTFSPKATGTRTGTLSFNDDASGSPQTAALSGTGNPATLVSIALTPAAASIALGTSQQFTATGTYTDGSTQNLTASVAWSSSVPGVAAVSAGGLATSVGQGSSSISATLGSVVGSVILTVTAPALTAIAVSPATATVASGGTQQFAASGTYSNGSTQDVTASASWTSSASGIAKVSSGLASGVGAGSASITAMVGTVSGSAALTVTAAPTLVSLAVSPANGSFALGTMQQLAATGTYSDGSTLDMTAQVAWSTADGTIASVNSRGLATSIAVGSTTVSATSGAIVGTTGLTVTPAQLVSLALTPAIPSIPSGMTQPFAATGSFTDGTMQTVTQSVVWSSSAPTVASVSNASGSQGVATAVAAGTSTIAASSGNITASTTLTITPAVLETITISPANPLIALGTAQQLVATGIFSDGSTMDLTATAAWASDDAAVASVSAGGLGNSAAIGTANISATVGTVAGSTGLTVTAAALVSIAIGPPSATIPLGTTQQFTATGTYTDGTTQDVTRTGHWSSTSASVATISNSTASAGLATTLGVGGTTISVSVGAVSASATLTVSPAALTAIAVTPLAPSIPLGTAQQFTASGTYTDGTSQDITSTVTWSATPATVGVASNAMGQNGLVTSSGIGIATVSASLGAITFSTTLTVSSAALVSIAISPQSPTVALGTPQSFTATGTYTDGSTANVTGSVSWSSANGSVATISSGGLATTVASGVATISANSGTISSSTQLTVGSAALVSLSLSPQGSSIALGLTQAFSATGTYTDGSTQNLTASVTWASSLTAVATMNGTSAGSGVATSVGVGTTSISATLGAISTATTLSVTSAVVLGLAISPQSPSTSVGSTKQFTATATYTDGTTQNVTSQVVWTSSNPVVATLSNNPASPGLATTTEVGTTNVVATQGTLSTSTLLTVACGGPGAPCAGTNTPQLPQVWVNNHECDAPNGVYDLVKTVKASGGDYAGTQAGLNQAISDWVGGPDEWELVQVDAGLVLSGKVQINIGAKTGASKCLRIQSSNPPAANQTVCSHQINDLPGGKNPRNPGCTNDSAHLYVVEQTNYGNHVITCLTGANHVVVEDGEFRPNVSNTSGIWMPLLGCGEGSITSTAQLPSHVGFAYNYVHGWVPSDPGAPSNGTKLGTAIEANCVQCWFLYNYAEKVVQEGGESHVAHLINTPGPQKWVGNFFEGGAISWFTGGGSCLGANCSPTSIPGVVPGDLEVRRNRFTRDITWTALTGKLCQPNCPNHWGIKNTLEIKVGQRILLDGNIIENSWVDGQSGFALLNNIRDCSGGTVCDILVNGQPAQITSDLTFSNSIVRNAAQGIQIDGRSGIASNGGGVSQGARRWSYNNLLLYNLADSAQFGLGGNNYIMQLGASLNSFNCTAGRDAAGLVATLTCASGGQGFNEAGISAGDIVQVTTCADPFFNTPYSQNNNQAAVGVTALSPTSAGSLVVSYSNPGTAGATTIGCTLGNRGGWPNGLTVQHMTAATDGSGRYALVYGSTSLLQNLTLQNTITVSAVVAAGTGGGLTSVNPVQEGTLASTCCVDTSTFTLNTSLFQGRVAANYTEYGGIHAGASPPTTLYFPANISCAGANADGTCVGMSGFMNGAPFTWNPADYHGFALSPSSLYRAGAADQASDGTDLGADIALIDNAQVSPQYVCASACGNGPFPD